MFESSESPASRCLSLSEPSQQSRAQAEKFKSVLQALLWSRLSRARCSLNSQFLLPRQGSFLGTQSGWHWQLSALAKLYISVHMSPSAPVSLSSPPPPFSLSLTPPTLPLPPVRSCAVEQEISKTVQHWERFWVWSQVWRRHGME